MLVSIMLFASGIAVVCILDEDSGFVSNDLQYTYIRSWAIVGGLRLDG
jgi:hypothetical protein